MSRLTSSHRYIRITDVQRFSAYLGVVAVLVALVTAPLYHAHDPDNHGSHESVVHAHFLDHHEAEPHAADEIEASDSHHKARWVDFFTLQVPSDAFALAIDLPEDSAVPVLKQSRGVILTSEPRAHSPPETRFSIPRSPPTL
ncbi:MAG TPA: hypothetical protein VFR18_14145 [Terriglobia bacterium]|nr:hypothetical protein [Terriglobia bacterium]